MALQLYAFWRSSASYRVRIALNLKLVEYEIVPIHIARDGGEQRREEYRRKNPQALVPLLVDGDFTLGQSLAIFHYLEDRLPQPSLVPADACDRARMWSFCQSVACEIQPLQNLRVLNYLGTAFGADEAGRSQWLQHWIGQGLAVLEEELARRPESPYCFGDTPTFADCCLVPQMFTSERFQVDLSALPRLRAITARCREHPAFAAAHPFRQPDAEPA